MQKVRYASAMGSQLKRVDFPSCCGLAPQRIRACQDRRSRHNLIEAGDGTIGQRVPLLVVGP